MQYNTHMKHLHPKHCVSGTAGTLRVHPLWGHTGMRVKL